MSTVRRVNLPRAARCRAVAAPKSRDTAVNGGLADPFKTAVQRVLLTKTSKPNRSCCFQQLCNVETNVGSTVTLMESSGNTAAGPKSVPMPSD